MVLTNLAGVPQPNLQVLLFIFLFATMTRFSFLVENTAECWTQNPQVDENNGTRKTTITRLLHSGIAPTTVQRLSDHKNTRSVSNYEIASTDMQHEMCNIRTRGPFDNTRVQSTAALWASPTNYRRQLYFYFFFQYLWELHHSTPNNSLLVTPVTPNNNAV